MSSANEQQPDAGGRRGWWLVVLLAVSGAAVGAFAAYRLDPDVSELVPSLAVAGFGLGGLIGLLLLAPVGLWRAWRRRARRRAATSERADLPYATGLWHTVDPEREAAPAAAAEQPGHGAVEAPTAEKTEPERPEESAPGAGAEEREALTPQEQPESEREEPGEPAAKNPRLEPERPEEPASGARAEEADALTPQQPESEHEEPREPAGKNPGPELEEPPPPTGEAPGWYPDPARDGMRRYWDGHAWTGHVWRGRARERTRKGRNRH